MHSKNHNFKILSDEIVSLSKDKEWLVAKLEWELTNVYYEDEPQTCLCTIFPL